MEQVNIILAAYNGKKYIEEQIRSILDNEYKNIRVWVFDDGSIDGTDEIIKGLEHNYPERISFYKNSENKGLTRNFLEGVLMVSNWVKEEGKGQNNTNYYMFSDQDDFWHKDKINKSLHKIISTEKKYDDNKPVVVYSDALVVDEHLKVINSSFHKSNNLDVSKTDLSHLLMENKLIGCTIMFNEALVGKLGQNINRGIRYHDWWVALIAASFGHIAYIQDATLSYRQHGNNMIGDQSFQKYVLDRLKNLKDQNASIEKNFLQAKIFYKTYGHILNRNEKVIIKRFININTKNWLRKRIIVLKYGYLKTGFIRNFGLLLCL